ncbi:MAG: S49 family peptidase, partial [Pseudomonadota bacterium]
LMGEVIRDRYGDKAELQLMQVKRGLFGRPQPGVGVFSGKDGFAKEIGTGIATGLPDALIDAAEERALWSRFGL